MKVKNCNWFLHKNVVRVPFIEKSDGGQAVFSGVHSTDAHVEWTHKKQMVFKEITLTCGDLGIRPLSAPALQCLLPGQ